MARLRSLPLIFVVALAIRLWFLWDYAAPRQVHALATIPFLFEPGNIAVSLAEGHGFASPFRVETGPTAWMSPVYPLLLAAIFKIFGLYTVQSFLAAAVLNILASTLTCLPLYAAARRMFGTGIAATTTWMWAVFPNAILLAYESMFEGSISALLAALLLWSALRASDGARFRDWALHGFIWGAALMTNASLVALLPFILGWAEYRAHTRPGFTIARPALAALVAILCCTPWTLRNYLVFHEFVPLRSVAGLALWLGNNDRAASTTPNGMHPISNQDERDHYVEVGEPEYMREKQSLALDYIPKHLAQTARLTAERATAFWSGGSPHPFDDARRARALRFFLVIPANLLVALCAVAGIIFLWRERSPFLIPLAAFPLVFPMVFYLALAHARYKHPIDPVLLILAAFTLDRLRNASRLGRLV